MDNQYNVLSVKDRAATELVQLMHFTDQSGAQFVQDPEVPDLGRLEVDSGGYAEFSTGPRRPGTWNVSLIGDDNGLGDAVVSIGGVTVATLSFGGAGGPGTLKSSSFTITDDGERDVRVTGSSGALRLTRFSLTRTGP